MVAESVTVSVVTERQFGERRRARLHDGDLAEGRLQDAHGGERAALPSASAISQHAGAGAEGGQRLRRAEHVDQAAADAPRRRASRR